MYIRIKRLFYFPLAFYFRFFASLRLKFWNPRIIVITGSSGKTTLLHLVESQIGDKAKYTHEANSSFGIPFDILGIHRKDLTFIEWPKIVFLPIFSLFKPVPREKIYIVEADCDRPYEGNFISSLLKPEVTAWTNVSRTHSMNFDRLVGKNKFSRIENAIAYEFGYFIERTRNLVIINDDDLYEASELGRTMANVVSVSSKHSLKNYSISLGKTEFKFDDFVVSFRYLMPGEISTSILMARQITNYLGIEFDVTFGKFILPPGRNSLFEGIKGTTIVDSTYNANMDSMSAVVGMFGKIKARKKWVVLGDMLEQGKEEKEEHENLAKLILNFKFDRIILMGPRVTQYTKPLLPDSTVAFLGPKEVLEYLKSNLRGGEIILFKGARFLEGVIEHLLKNKKNIEMLSRREKIWEIRRKKWGL